FGFVLNLGILGTNRVPILAFGSKSHIQRRALGTPTDLVSVPELRLDGLVGELARLARRDVVDPELRDSARVGKKRQRLGIGRPHRTPARTAGADGRGS